jgi:hypothetical protein
VNTPRCCACHPVDQRQCVLPKDHAGSHGADPLPLTPITIPYPDGSAAIVMPEPRLCPGCGRMAALLVNRLGRTLCTDCDARMQL